MFISRTSQLFIVLLVLAVALSTASFVVHSTPSAPDLSSDSQIENVRLQRSFSLIDTSYNRVEQVRFSRGLATDRSYENIEAIRLLR